MDIYKNSFQNFAEIEAKHSSPLYYFWSKKIIEDKHLMEIVRCIPLSQPKPNLFFASMHYLVSRSSSTLRNYYPSLTDNALPIEDSFDAFKQFALAHKKQLYDLFQSKLVQTNEVRRSAYLYPIFLSIAKQTNKPLALIEIGTSSGLLLCPDKYNYEIQQQQET